MRDVYRQMMPVALLAATVSLPSAAQEFRSYYVVDALDSPILSADSNVNLKWTEDYRPYGERIGQSSSASNDGDNERWFTGAPQNDVSGLIYLGHRYYDPVVGRFLSNDPVGVLADLGENFNRYWYANNNPHRYTDPDGRWASQKGFYVHQRATYLVIGRFLPIEEHRILAHAHVTADAPQFQDAASSFRHAMRNGEQTVEEARQQANDFVRNQFQRAWEAPTREEALSEFGIALHTLQDSTSPSHAGFQRWTGHETKREIFRHVRQEVINPGEDSELFRVTADAWRWFNEKKLPEGNLFTYGADD